MPIIKCDDLEIYKRSFKAAMEIFQLVRNFPKEEKYSLADQILRSSRSIPANIREGFAKKKYSDVFMRHLNDALGSAEETKTWLAFSFKCGYLEESVYKNLNAEYEEL